MFKPGFLVKIIGSLFFLIYMEKYDADPTHGKEESFSITHLFLVNKVYIHIEPES